MTNKKSVLKTLLVNSECSNEAVAGIAGNYWLIPINVLQNYENTCKD